MIRSCRRNGHKLYTAFVITTLLIATGLMQLSTRPFVLKFGKKDPFFGQLQFKIRLVNITKEVKRDVFELEKEATFVKIKDARVYMFSAILGNNQTQNNLRKGNEITRASQMVIVSGWELEKHSESSFICCYILKNGTILSKVSSSKSHWHFLEAELQAKQFICPLTEKVSDITMVSITLQNTTCPRERRFFIQPTALYQRQEGKNNDGSKIGICIKLSFGSLDARRLIEWFEMHRLFGVDKVITYMYNLNTVARKVLEFYKNIGLAEVFDFDLPEKELINREVGGKNMQAWNDEQIVLFDCQERLRNYDYVAVVDTDEFMIPSTGNFVNAWKTFLNKKLRETNFAGVFFPVQVHPDTWGPTHTKHPLHIGRYNNCTLPMFDRVKGIYMPSRVQQGTVSTHVFKPLKGYRSGDMKAKEATLHHFRSCRDEWMIERSDEKFRSRNYLYYGKNRTKCYDLKRTPSEIIQRLSNTVKDRVRARIQEIGV